MKKVQFNRPVKYNGKKIPANTIFGVDDKDLKEVLADGGFLIDESPAQPTEKELKAAADLAALKEKAIELGLPVEEDDTALSLQTKIGVKTAELADAEEKAKELETAKAAAVTAGVPVEDADTVDTLTAKIAAKAAKEAEEADAAKAREVAKDTAEALGLTVEETDTVEQIQKKIDDENARLDADVSPYKGWDKPKFVAELEARQIDQTDLTNNEKREAALIADDAAKLAAAGQA